MSTKTRKPGSGRTKGSFSFVAIPLNELTGKFADQSTQVIVSRKWAEQVGFKAVSAPAKTVVEKIQGQTPESKVQAVVTNFDSE